MPHGSNWETKLPTSSIMNQSQQLSQLSEQLTTDRQTNWETDRQTNRQTGALTVAWMRFTATCLCLFIERIFNTHTTLSRPLSTACLFATLSAVIHVCIQALREVYIARSVVPIILYSNYVIHSKERAMLNEWWKFNTTHSQLMLLGSTCLLRINYYINKYILASI